VHRSIGSTWGKWDLHVHMPATLLNNQFGGNTEEAWEEFLEDLASLPPSSKVLGISDYLFLDGYRRVYEAWVGGRPLRSNSFYQWYKFGSTSSAGPMENLVVSTFTRSSRTSYPPT
jgi:hypothetical protein